MKKYKAGTIASYVSAIATVRNVARGSKLSKNPQIAAMLKGFKQDDMKSRFKPPAWDLNLVLESLTKFPYEPLEEANLRLLSHKTAFLLTFATAARVSEVHALDVTLLVLSLAC